MSAKPLTEKLAAALRALGYTTSDIVGGGVLDPDTFSFWIFRPFKEAERGSKTYTKKKVAMLRVAPDASVHIEMEWEPGTRKVLQDLGMKVVAKKGVERKPPRERTSSDFRRDVSSKYGAPMGRGRSTLSEHTTARLRLEHVPLNSGGYDPGGAYWGGGQPLYLASDDDGNQTYLRASSREAAKAKFPKATFFR